MIQDVTSKKKKKNTGNAGSYELYKNGSCRVIKTQRKTGHKQDIPKKTQFKLIWC